MDGASGQLLGESFDAPAIRQGQGLNLNLPVPLAPCCHSADTGWLLALVLAPKLYGMCVVLRWKRS